MTPIAPPPTSPIISCLELSKILGVTDATTRRWFLEGTLPPRFGKGRLRWLKTDLIAAGLLPAENISSIR